MYKNLIFATFLLLFFACVDAESAKHHNIQDAKWTAVMANHDVVMPMMGTTNKVRKKLKSVLAAKENLPVEKTEKINALIIDLDKADESMMDWMNGFPQLKKLQAEKDHKEIIKFLDEQDVVIKGVGMRMTNSIKAGLDYVERLEQ